MTIRPLRVVVARGGRAWMGPGNEALVEKFYKEDCTLYIFEIGPFFEIITWLGFLVWPGILFE